MIECKGPTNGRTYTVAVYFRGQRLASAQGHNIQQAEMNAANKALETCKGNEKKSKKHINRELAEVDVRFVSGKVTNQVVILSDNERVGRSFRPNNMATLKTNERESGRVLTRILASSRFFVHRDSLNFFFFLSFLSFCIGENSSFSRNCIKLRIRVGRCGKRERCGEGVKSASTKGI